MHAGGRRGLAPWSRAVSPAVIRRLVDGFAPDFVVLTRYAAEAGEETLRMLLRNRASVFCIRLRRPQKR
jgi:hypothetical protein